MNQSRTILDALMNGDAGTSDLFLSVIAEDGMIMNANANMINTIGLNNSGKKAINFFDLIHPAHVRNFQQTIRDVRDQHTPHGIELFIRNGHYHPMKWQVSVIENADECNSYLCSGYRILDEERMSRFNDLLKENTELILEGLSGIVFHDDQGDIIATNQKTAVIFGTTLERLYQLKDLRSYWENPWQIRTEEGEPVKYDETPFMRTLRTGESSKATYHIRVGDGVWKWIFYDSYLIPGIHGADNTVVSHLVDVTHERELTLQVREKDALIGSYLRQTPHLAWVVDEHANLLFASDTFYQHFRIDPATVKGRKAMDLVPASVTLAIYDQHIGVLESGVRSESTQQVKWADGENYSFYVHTFPIESFNGVRLVGGQAIRLPDKSKLEKELRDTHERLLTYSRATSDAIWEWDMQTGQMFGNETLMQMIGYLADNARGLTWWLRQIHPEDRNRVADRVKEATDALQQSWQEEYRFRCADGSYKFVQDKGFVVYENGLPVKMIGSLQDVSALKALQHKLDDERLQRQKDISETVIRVQEKERTRIGHELHDNVNQILSTAKLFIDMLAPAGKEQQEMRQKSSEYLLLAIEEIRKLSRELVVPQIREDSLADAVQHLIQDISIAGTIKIVFMHSNDLTMLSPGRATTLFRIIQEQIKNILKHSKANEVEINLEADDEWIRLQIEDNGRGFNPSQTHQGIGLSNIRERTLFYNGTVEIDSKPGDGCRLIVKMPVE